LKKRAWDLMYWIMLFLAVVEFLKDWMFSDEIFNDFVSKFLLVKMVGEGTGL
jgi:hypothetical protein